MSDFYFNHPGTCPGCDRATTFTATGPYFRETLVCSVCGSQPRNRALMHAVHTYFPNWRAQAIHECSPGWDIVSQRLVAECTTYTATHYDVRQPWGETSETSLPCKKFRHENLEEQTFPDEMFDIVLMQDVFEHIMRPDKAIKEIARTLKPGGAMVMTVPIVQQTRPSRRRCRLDGFRFEHILPPEYHGNPLGGGSLVIVDWGYDIIDYLQAHSGMSFMLLQVENIDLGIKADLNDVIIGFKRPPPDLA